VVPARAFLAATAAAAAAGTRRRSLANPAAGWLATLAGEPRVAVLGVPCRTVGDLRRLHGYLLEPAFRRRCHLLVHTDRALEDLDPARLVDPDRGYPWTLERLRYLVAAWHRRPPAGPSAPGDGGPGGPGGPDGPDGPGGAGDPPRPAGRVSRWCRLRAFPWSRGDTAAAGTPPDRHRPAPPHLARLDAQQRAAATAGDGVVQVIAPAGSGKTTVLVARVAELVARGTPAHRILCAAFNRDARREIAARLVRAGLGGVRVRTFHGLGREILAREGRLRPRLGDLAPADWQALAGDPAAVAPDGVPLTPAAARQAVGGFKLGAMVDPDTARILAAGADPAARTAARLYAAHEALLARRQQHDLDDLILGAVTLLQTDAAVRHRWQARCERVLVDEYQDIEPAQARLVDILAAPQDSLFCVGDEDQCIYAWRRARVQSVVELDQVHPGLERHALARNYRCGQRITGASRRLIAHNRQRFRKPLHAGAPHRGEITVHAVGELPAAAALRTVALLREVWPGSVGAPPDVVVLARSLALLREVAGICRRAGVPWRADPRVLAALPGAARSAGDGGPAAGGAAAGAPDPDGHAVELATIHAAKGREWDHVILHGVDQGHVPSLPPGGCDRELAPDHLEAERRLFYVALTRARRRLDLVCTRGRASQFLAEAGLRPR
jgi:superfamily I DNA/RNA helicase